MADSEEIAQARYSRLTWNCPLSSAHADELLGLLNLTAHTQIVDLGCGWGSLLLRAAALCASRTDSNSNKPVMFRVTGVDTDGAALERARRAAAAAGLGPEHVSFVEQAVEDWRPPPHGMDRAICLGSSHAMGGTRKMLARLAELMPAGRGARVLLGDTCWEREPTDLALSMFQDEALPLADLVAVCRETGWEVLHLSTADQREWDDFESRHRMGTREWLLAHPDSSRAPELRAQENKREQSYLTGYRGVLGFAYLVLGR
jgi:SAM-dependent methyltransferase